MLQKSLNYANFNVPLAYLSAYLALKLICMAVYWALPYGGTSCRIIWTCIFSQRQNRKTKDMISSMRRLLSKADRAMNTSYFISYQGDYMARRRQRISEERSRVQTQLGRYSNQNESSLCCNSSKEELNTKFLTVTIATTSFKTLKMTHWLTVILRTHGKSNVVLYHIQITYLV